MAFPTDSSFFRRFLEELILRPATASHPDLSTASIFVALFKSTLAGYNLDTDYGWAASPTSNYWSTTYEVSAAGNYDSGGKAFNSAPTVTRGSTAAGSILSWGVGAVVAWTADTWSNPNEAEFALVYDSAPATTKWGIAAVNIPTLAPNGGSSSVTWSSGILTFN